MLSTQGKLLQCNANELAMVSEKFDTVSDKNGNAIRRGDTVIFSNGKRKGVVRALYKDLAFIRPHLSYELMVVRAEILSHIPKLKPNLVVAKPSQQQEDYQPSREAANDDLLSFENVLPVPDNNAPRFNALGRSNYVAIRSKLQISKPAAEMGNVVAEPIRARRQSAIEGVQRRREAEKNSKNVGKLLRESCESFVDTQQTSQFTQASSSSSSTSSWLKSTTQQTWSEEYENSQTTSESDSAARAAVVIVPSDEEMPSFDAAPNTTRKKMATMGKNLKRKLPSESEHGSPITTSSSGDDNISSGDRTQSSLALPDDDDDDDVAQQKQQSDSQYFRQMKRKRTNARFEEQETPSVIAPEDPENIAIDGK